MYPFCCRHTTDSGSWLNLGLPCFYENVCSLLISMWMLDIVFGRWWKNNIHNPCGRVRLWPVFGHAYSQWVHKKSVPEFFLINQVDRNHCNPIGLYSYLMHLMFFSCNFFWSLTYTFDRSQETNWNGLGVVQMMTLLPWLPKMEWSFLVLAT